MKTLSFLTILAFALLATPAMSRDQLYLGAGVAYNVTPLAHYSGQRYEDGIGPQMSIGLDMGRIGFEGNMVMATHHETDPGYRGRGTEPPSGHTDVDFTGLSVDLKILHPQPGNRNQIYLLVGGGYYTFDYDTPSGHVKHTGEGFDLGAGLIFRFNELIAIDTNVVWRSIDHAGADRLCEEAIGERENYDVIAVGTGLRLCF